MQIGDIGLNPCHPCRFLSLEIFNTLRLTKPLYSMKKVVLLLFSVAFCAYQANAFHDDLTSGFIEGKADVQSLSVLTFSPQGILFIGDSKSGKIFALDPQDKEKNQSKEAFQMENIDEKVASLLGASSHDIVIHDMAVNPRSQNVYLAVSRTNARELGFWKLPNDLNYANLLLKVKRDGSIEEVSLDNISHSFIELQKLVNEGKQTWRKSDQRTETITDLAYSGGKLYVAGLSNEEFASALRIIPFPFDGTTSFSTVEVWHVAHGKSETEAPIRTLLPYTLDKKEFILASYTCTPFVSIPVSELENGKHVKSRTLGEFGFGNMPVDIIAYQNKGKAFLLMSNMSKALIRIDPEDIPRQEALTHPLKEWEYTVGLPHEVLSRVGITQMDNLNEDNVLVLQRSLNGTLNLRSYPTKWL